MRIYFIGTAGAGGPPGRARASLLIESKSARVVLDFGEASSWRLHQLGLTLRDIDLIYVSHEHLDHWGGLFDAAVMALARGGLSKLRVATHESLVSIIESLIKPTLPREIRDSTEFLGIGRELRIGDLRISPVKSRHTVPTYGVVVSSGDSVIYYTSDTAQTEEVIKVAELADLVIHEATLPGGMEELARFKGHSTVDEVIKLSMRVNGIVATFHLSIESEDYVLRKLSSINSKKLIVPNDLTVIEL